MSHARLARASLPLIAILAACSDTLTPNATRLQIATVTSGVSLDPDGYELRLRSGAGGGETRPVAANSQSSFDRLPGTYTATLGGVSPNCAIGGEPARIFTVTGDLQVDSTTFDITCAHANGSIAVYTALPEAAGPGPFTVTLDGVDHRSLGPIDSTRFTDLADGAHLLVIDGVNLTTSDRCLEPVHSLSIVVSGGTSMPDTITGFVERASFGCD